MWRCILGELVGRVPASGSRIRKFAALVRRKWGLYPASTSANSPASPAKRRKALEER